MPSGNPTFGGVNGVAVLDIGQAGGTRHTADTAFATLEVIEHADDVAQVKQSFPQQNLSAVDIMGFRGKRVTWRGTLRGSTPTQLAISEGRIEEKRSGRYRDPADGTVTVDLDQIKPTLLQRDDLKGTGTALIQSPAQAVLKDFRRIGPRRRITGWASGQTIAVAQEVEIDFEILGDNA